MPTPYVLDAQFIDETWLVQNTPINANIDVALVAPFIRSAQDLHIQPVLGTTFYIHLQDQIVNGLVTSDEDTLLKIIRPALAYWTVVFAIPFVAVEVRGAGVVRATNDRITPASLSEISLIRSESTNIAEFYTQRIQDWLCKNRNLYPQYIGTQIPIHPTAPQFDGGVYYRGGGGCCGDYNCDDRHCCGGCGY